MALLPPSPSSSVPNIGEIVHRDTFLSKNPTQYNSAVGPNLRTLPTTYSPSSYEAPPTFHSPKVATESDLSTYFQGVQRTAPPATRPLPHEIEGIVKAYFSEVAKKSVPLQQFDPGQGSHHAPTICGNMPEHNMPDSGTTAFAFGRDSILASAIGQHQPLPPNNQQQMSEEYKSIGPCLFIPLESMSSSSAPNSNPEPAMSAKTKKMFAMLKDYDGLSNVNVNDQRQFQQPYQQRAHQALRGSLLKMSRRVK